VEPQDIQKTLRDLSDNQVVQGQLLGRIERLVESNSRAIASHDEILTRHERAIEGIVNGMVSLQGVVAQLVDAVQGTQDEIRGMQDEIRELAEGQKAMQTSMGRLFERMDRFIRGLESNGHEPG
jgi:chromosome segregation ATPase